MPRFQCSQIDQQIGRRIKQRRVDLGLSQTELAKALGMSFQQVQKYESGKSQIAACLLLEISRHLCVPITHFFFEASYYEPAKPTSFTITDWTQRRVSIQYGELFSRG